MLARYDMGARQAESGRFDEIFMGPARFPMLSIASWLLDDLASLDAPSRDPIERHLFVASVLMAMRAHLNDALADPSSFADHGAAALAQHCAERSMHELMLTVPMGSGYWEQHVKLVVDDLEARLTADDVTARSVAHQQPDAWLDSTWSAPARSMASAVAAIAGRPEAVPLLHAMLDDLAAALQVDADLRTMHHDLLVGRITYPIAAVAYAAGMPLHPMPSAERVLGALVLTRSLPAIMQAASDRVQASRSAADELGLGSFSSFIGQVQRRVSANDGPTSDGVTRPEQRLDEANAGPRFRIAEDTSPRAVRMAGSFLSVDASLRESWETHREGMLGSEEVASRFPAGLILAWLCEDGRDMSNEVDGFLAFTVSNRFRYYDHPWSGVDADTIGVCLRLLSHSTDPSRHQGAMDGVLACLGTQVRREGSIPVWVTDCDPPSDVPSDAIALGEGCATVAAHLLLGILAAAPAGHLETVERGGSALLHRLASAGLAANVNYPPPYSAGLFLRLVRVLEGAGLDGPMGEAGARARRTLEPDFDRIIARPPRTAQEAALLTVACRDAGRIDRLDPRWLPPILKAQRPDGSWPPEPFAAAPHRDGWVSWYSSSTLTTALCHSAILVHSGDGTRSLAARR